MPWEQILFEKRVHALDYAMHIDGMVCGVLNYLASSSLS